MASRTALPVLCLLVATGCFEPGKGVEPPTNQPYFPVGVAVSPTASRLFLVSSDYDLQYTGGVLQVLDLERVRALVPDPEEPSCGPFREQKAAARLNVPTRCGYVDLVRPQDGGDPLLLDFTKIGAFATDVVYRQSPAGIWQGTDDGRLFVPVRGDATLHYIDVDVEGRLNCDQDDNDGRCTDRYRVGDDPEEENTRGFRMPPEPFAIDASSDGRAVVVTHQTDGNVSLFVNDWKEAESAEEAQAAEDTEAPKLEFVTGDLPARAVGVAALPVPALADVLEDDPALDGERLVNAVYDPGFLVTFRDSPEVRLLRFFDDDADPPRHFIEATGTTIITANSVGVDSRGVAVDATKRRRCEAACPDADTACLKSCVIQNPLGIYVANRAPNSLLVGRSRPIDNVIPMDEVPFFYDSVPLPLGVSRVVVGDVIDRAGARQPRVFVVCFDQRKIAIYDPTTRMIEKFVETGRGPHALAIDVDPDPVAENPGWAYGYVAHFSDSWVGVIDLDQRNTQTYGTLVLALGRPTPPRGSK